MGHRSAGGSLAGAKELWLTGKSQPNACDSLFGAWRASGKQDPLAYLERIRLAMKAGNTRLVMALAGQMPSDYQTISTAVMSLANDPNSVLTFARSTGATDFTRQMAAVAFASVARDDVENARLMIRSWCRHSSSMKSKPRNCATSWRGD